MAKTLLTGGTGLIGSHVARALLERGDDLRLTVRESSRTDNLDGLDCDRCAPTSTTAARYGGRSKASTACHVAGLTSLRAPAARLYRVNVDGTRTVLEECLRAGVERVVYTSSVAAVGPAEPGWTADEPPSSQPAATASRTSTPSTRRRSRRCGSPRQRATGRHRQPRARVRPRGPVPVLHRCRTSFPHAAPARLRGRWAQRRRRRRRRRRAPGRGRARRGGRALHPRQPQLHARAPVRRPRPGVGRRTAGAAAAAAGRARDGPRGRTAARAAADHDDRGAGQRPVVDVPEHQGQARARLGARHHEDTIEATVNWYREREGSRLADPGARQALPLRVAGFAARRAGALVERVAP